MSTIAQIIEIARSTQHRDSHSADKVLCDHAIRMAEALQLISKFKRQGGMCEPDSPSREAEIARDALAAVERDFNQGD